MRAAWMSSVLVLVLTNVCAAAVPDEPPAAPPPKPPEANTKQFARLEGPSLVHDMQFGIALLPGSGYRGIFPYKDGINCGEAAKRVCTGFLPFFLDVQPSFGFATAWDVLVDLRFGISQDFTHSHEFAVAPGVRYWIDPEQQLKFFATIQFAYDATPPHDPLVKSYDLAFRNSNGVMYDVMRNFGVYFQLGETIGVVRWLRFEIDGGVGVQARFP
jgi:hypothetical protein